MTELMTDRIAELEAALERVTREKREALAQLAEARLPGPISVTNYTDPMSVERLAWEITLAERDEARRVANEVQRMALEGADLEAFQRFADQFQWMDFPG